MAAQETLREYLLRLGFSIDKREAKQFEDTLEGVGKTAGIVGGALVGVATAAAALAQVYANQMEKMYYASRHTGSTIQELQALGYASKQAGVDTSSGIEAITAALRNRGKRGFMSQLLGREVGENESPAKLFPELIKALKASSPDKLVRGAYAKQIGFNENEYFDYEKALDKIVDKTAEYNAMIAATGVDLQKVGESMVEWNNLVGRVAASFNVLEGVIAMKALGPMHELVKTTTDWLDGLSRDLIATQSFGEFINKRVAKEGRGEVGGWGAASPGGGWFGDPDTAIADWLRSFANGGRGVAKPASGAGRAASGSSGGNPATGGYTQAQIQDAMDKLEVVYDLPHGTLAAIMQVESAGGSNLTSKTGVQGPMQITAKNFYSRGGTDRNDMMENLSVAAQMMHENMQGGHDVRQAASMYGNGTYRIGEAGNPGGDPAYVNKFDKAIAQVNHITINGGDADKIKVGVEGALDKSNGDLVRNAKGALQ